MHRNRYFIAFLLILLLSCIYVFVFGESGLLERYMLESRKNQLLEKNRALAKDNQGLEKKLRRLAAGHAEESDLAGAGFVRQGGKILVIEGGKKREKEIPSVPAESSEKLPVAHLRIIWIVLSLLLLLLYFSRAYRTSGQENDVFQD